MLARCLARRRDPDVMNHGEQTTTIHVLGDAAPSAMQETDPGMHDQLDAAYRTMYRHDGAHSIDPMVAPETRAATIKLVPREIG